MPVFFITDFFLYTTVEPLYSSHCWGMTFWLLYRGGWGLHTTEAFVCLIIGTRAVDRYIEDGCCKGVTVKRGSTVLLLLEACTKDVCTLTVQLYPHINH